MAADYVTGHGQELFNVHGRDACMPSPCVIHNPTYGPWSGWPTLWRNDRLIMERVCPHGVGHPVVEDLGRMPEYMFVHGCCGCSCLPGR